MKPGIHLVRARWIPGFITEWGVWEGREGPGGVCGPVPTDAVFTWAQAKKLLHIG